MIDSTRCEKTGVTVRAAKPEDAARILEIEKECFSDVPSNTERYSLRAIAHNIERNHVLVAEEDSGIVGVMLGSARTSWCKDRIVRGFNINCLAVIAGERGKGIGNRLMDAAEALYPTVPKTLCARHDRPSVLRFYTGRGYRGEWLKVNAYGDGVAAWYMRKEPK